MEEHNMSELQSRVEKYSNAEDLVGVFDGHMSKSAVRIADNKNRLIKRQMSSDVAPKKTANNSLFFGELFRALMSKDCSYVTYLNDLFVGKKRSEMYIPEYVSCIVKKSSSHSDCQLETIGSRLANLFGVDTVYNLAIQSDEQDEEYEDDPVYDAMVSVDFIPYGYRLETFTNLKLHFDEDSSLEEIFNVIDGRFNYIAEDNGLEKSIDKLAELKRKFAYQYLFRNLVCEDYDFCDKNSALLMGENGDFKLAPCFDMELLFRGKKSHYYYASFANKTIEYMLKTMPEVLDSFMARYKDAVTSGQASMIAYNSVKIDPQYSKDISDHIVRNYQRLSSIVAEQKNNMEMIED